MPWTPSEARARARPMAKLPAVTVSLGDKRLVEYLAAEADVSVPEWIRRWGLREKMLGSVNAVGR